MTMVTDHRGKFFEMLRVVGENRFFKDEYAIELFLSVFEMHRGSGEGVITADNMTDKEKAITTNHLADFMHNTGICFRGFFSKNPRELLSGMVVFRVELFPVLICFLNREREWYAQLLSFFHNNERGILRVLEHPRNLWSDHLQVPDYSHALHKHPWWRGEYKQDADLESPYDLTD